jgi:crotonobetaine/carnitine-CoA ligase
MSTTTPAQAVWTPGEPTTVVDVFRGAAERFGTRPFLDFTGDTYTFQEVWDRGTRVAAGLRGLGVESGDTVLALLDSSVDSVAVWIGVNMLGAIWVPTNTALRGVFLSHQVGDAAARVVIAEADYAARVLDVVDDLPDLRHLVCRGGVPDTSTGSFAIDDLSNLLACDPLEDPVSPEPGSLAMLIYTSGTTGPSKGCMLSHNYVCNVARGSSRSRQPDDVLWTPLPLFHLNATATSVLAAAMLGIRLYVYPRFSLRNFWPEMQRTGATVVSLLGAMIPLIATMDDTPEMLASKGQIRAAGGAPYTPEIARVWHERFGVEEVGSSVFGLTETTFLTSTPAGEKARWGTAGKQNDDFDVRIFDDNDVEVPVGEAGEIVARPRRPHVMFEGYWRRPEATQSVMRNMWFHTGDIGRFDEDGWLYFLDRKKDYLRRRGENISSQEVEGAFLQHPDLVEVAAHAVPSDLTEDDLKITAVRRDGSALTEEELCRWCLEKVPYFAVPRYIEFRTDLPRNPTGKVLKYQLRDEGRTDSTWDRETSGVEIRKR